MVARDENRNRNGHVLVWEQTDLAKEDKNIRPNRTYLTPPSIFLFKKNLFLLSRIYLEPLLLIKFESVIQIQNNLRHNDVKTSYKIRIRIKIACDVGSTVMPD